MLKHQKLFVAMEHRIESGIDVLDEYNQVRRDLDRALVSLEHLEHGCPWAVDQVQQHFGSQLSVHGVSLESVQVHVNSQQVQAIIDFLRKWIPKLVVKLKELGKKFIDWAQQTLHRLGERIDVLKKKLQTLESSSIEVVPPAGSLIGKVAFELHRTRQWDAFVTVDDFHVNLYDRALKLPDSEQGWDEIQIRMATKALNEVLGEWIYFRQEHTPAVVEGDIVATERSVAELSDFDSMSRQVLTQYVEQAKLDAPLTFKKDEAQRLIQELDRAQMDVLATTTGVRKVNENLTKRLVEVLKSAEQSSSAEFATAARLVYRMAVKMEAAITSGFQTRLRLLGAGVGLLEKAA